MVHTMKKYEISKALVKRHFSWPYDTPKQGEELIRAALTLHSLGYLNDSYPISVFVENKTKKLILYNSTGQLSAFYDDLQHEIYALLTGHLALQATEDPEVEAIEILSKLSRHERMACDRGKTLLEWHSKISKQHSKSIEQPLVGD